MLRGKRNGKKENRLSLVITYMRSLSDIGELVRKHVGISHNSVRMRKCFPAQPLVAFKRDRNLADVLVYGKLNRTLRSTDSQYGNITKVHVWCVTYLGKVYCTLIMLTVKRLIRGQNSTVHG